MLLSRARSAFSGSQGTCRGSALFCGLGNLPQFCCLQNGQSDVISRSQTPPSVAAGFLSASPSRLCPSCPENSGRRKAAGVPGQPGLWPFRASCGEFQLKPEGGGGGGRGLALWGWGAQISGSMDMPRGVRGRGLGPAQTTGDCGTLRMLGPLYGQEMGGSHP